jgi:uncharacterized protein DUF5681
MTTIRKPLRPKRARSRALVQLHLATTPYRVGPGFPPKEHQFRPGKSGNPDGARKRPPSIAPDLNALLQAALGKKVTLTIGDKERILTKPQPASNSWSINSRVVIVTRDATCLIWPTNSGSTSEQAARLPSKSSSARHFRQKTKLWSQGF